MIEEALDFLKTQRVGVIAVRTPQGTVHGATVHFAHSVEPLVCIFLASPTSMKVEALRQGAVPASFVVGTSEDVMKTLQMDGVATLAENDAVREAYFAKFPEKRAKHPDDAFFTFTPSWWRFTDWTAPDGKKIVTSS